MNRAGQDSEKRPPACRGLLLARQHESMRRWVGKMAETPDNGLDLRRPWKREERI
jgi:hypothetical protein